MKRQAPRTGPSRGILLCAGALLWLAIAPVLVLAQVAAPPAGSAVARVSVHGQTAATSILFIGNSFTYGAGSPVQYYRTQTVTDLNGDGLGGVPALFKSFTSQAGLNFAVSLETAPGMGLDYHAQEKAKVISRAWDYVVMQGYSTLDRDKPGDPALLVRSARQLADLLHGRNPSVDIRLVATWSRADQTYPKSGHWHGHPIEMMARDVRVGYDLAAASTPLIHGVIPVGEAWNRAISAGVANPNPYAGIAPGKIDLWTYDHYHASTFGYYLDALVVFGDITGLDPRFLGINERSAFELGLSPEQASVLQRIAFDELMAGRGNVKLREFTFVALPRWAN